MGEHMYKLYTNTSYAEGVRMLSGKTSGEFETYEEAIKAAMAWLKQNPNKGLLNICVVFDGIHDKLEIGERYDIYRGILAYPNEEIFFSEIEIQESPYKITGIYKGYYEDMQRSGYSRDGKSYIMLENAKGFDSIEGMEYGETDRNKWGRQQEIMHKNPYKRCVVVGESTRGYIPAVATCVAEFNSRDEARWRLYEMVLNGWDTVSSVIKRI